MDNNQLKQIITDSLDEHKAKQITTLDVSHLTDVAHYMIICNATSKRHAQALSEQLQRKLRKQGIKPIRTEGQLQEEWILVDCQDIIVHIMLPDARELYELEKLWQDKAT